MPTKSGILVVIDRARSFHMIHDRQIDRYTNTNRKTNRFFSSEAIKMINSFYR